MSLNQIIQVSDKLAAILNRLPRDRGTIFGSSWQTAHNSFYGERKRAAEKLGNPRNLQILFHTYRHWKGIQEHHKTTDILHVMRLLGHKNIANTLIYTQLVEFESDEYSSAVAARAR